MSQQREVERRWLVKHYDKRVIDDADSIEITQAYLDSPSDLRVRISTQHGCNGYDDTYELTRKCGKGLDRVEQNASLNDEAAQMLVKSTPFRIQKTRYKKDGWELDIFHGRLKGLVLLEWEYKGALPVDQIEWPVLPSWVYDAVEVTETLNNRQLATVANLLDDGKTSIGAMVDNVPWIVLTGAPCSGKSSIIESLRKDAAYHCVPEVATILMGQVDITPDVCGAAFQRTQYRVQRALEDAAAMSAIKKGKKALILDRGTLDSAAFESGGLSAYCDLIGTDAEIERNRYDSVILLGCLDQKLYEQNVRSNPIRRETWEQSNEIGIRLRKIWTGHRDLYEVNGSATLSQKEIAVRGIISRFIV